MMHSAPGHTPPVRQYNIKKRINMLRGLYSNTGAQIYLLPTPTIDQASAITNLPYQERVMGILTVDKNLTFFADQVSQFHSGGPAIIHTTEATLLCGPTFHHALVWGFYALACNFIKKTNNITCDDIVQHARDLKRAIDADGSLSGISEDMIFDFLKEFGIGTPIADLIDKLPQRKSFFRRLFGG